MSTRSTLKHDHDTTTGVGFHLFTDWLDECAGLEVVSVRLEGGPFKAACTSAGMSIELTLPRTLAEKLGLLPAHNQSGPTT